MKDYTEQLKNYWKSKDLAFIATLHKINENQGFFNHFTNPVSKMKLFYPVFDDVEVDEKRVSFFYGDSKYLKHGDFYKVELAYTEKPYEKNNPYSLRIKKVSSLDQLIVKNHIDGDSDVEFLIKVFGISSLIDKKTAKEHIRQRFERRTKDPDSNKIIANLMREIGKGMYSSKQRVIFELLQNADDAPDKEKVEFHIDFKNDYFFVMHDGITFSQDDIDAITSAAESTKRKDKKKTGYKGIGFKSVFTDSTEVWLKSGTYQFAFLRNSDVFANFETFYFSSSDYKEFPGLLEKHRKEYKKDIDNYDSSTDIPWQLIPIWQEELPEEFKDSNFNNFNNPVQFAIKVGENNINSRGGYISAIDDILKKPQFLLFLRNTSKFRSPKNRTTISRFDNNNIISLEKTVIEYTHGKGEQRKLKFIYLKESYPEIEVSDKAFLQENVGIKKAVKKNDLNEPVHYFVDVHGKEIETIPPKLASVDETEISFGIAIIDDKISPEREYLKELPKYSSLFTYLPMEDSRFQLPFLVNADFVPDSRREKLQGDNPWNKYIMIMVAEKHIETISKLANDFICNKERYSTYLSLLLKNTLPEDDTAQQIIDSYNEKYIKQLNNVPIIVNDKEQKQLLSETIIDDSGLIELFGHELFYEIIDTKKRLPHNDLEISFLKKYNYLDIEIIDIETLADIITPEMCERIGQVIAEKALYNEEDLLKWLNELVVFLPESFGMIPFIVHNRSLFSIERLLAENDAWIINKNTIDYEDLIEALGYHTINLQLEKYIEINNFLLSYDGYLNDKAQAYERISTNKNLSSLPVQRKIELLEFLQHSKFMNGIGETKYFGEIKIFVDEQGIPRPLRQLVSRRDSLETPTIQRFRIKEDEFENLPELLKKELIFKEEVFVSFILTNELFEEWSSQFNSSNISTYVDDLKSFFGWKDNEKEILQSKWAAIPWLYIDDDLRFVESNKIYWSNAFLQTSPEDYQIIKSILHNSKLKQLPIIACGDLVKLFDLKTDSSVISNWEEIDCLDTISANILLDWMEEDGNYDDFFENYTVTPIENNKWKIKKIENVQIFDGSEVSLKTYIDSNEVLKLLFLELNEALCTEKRYKIGLLQGDKLLNSVIESKSFDQNLASLLPQNLNWKQLESFVSNLPELKLKTEVIYDSNSPEHIILNQILKNIEENDSITSEILVIIDCLRNKISINLYPLSDFDLSDIIQFGKGDDKKELRLSDVLGEFKGESDVLHNVIESFTSITQKAKLRKVIFKTRRMAYEEINNKIEQETSSFYSVNQVVYQLLYYKYIGKKEWSKDHFDDYWKNQGNNSALERDYIDFFEAIFKLEFSELENFYFHGFDLKNCLDINWAIQSEIIPEWLQNWINQDPTKRLEFISSLGYHGTDSSIVKLRKAIISDQYDQNHAIRYFEEAKTNSEVLFNTISWLSNYGSEIVTRNISIIKQINNHVNIETENLNSLIIPVINSISKEGGRRYLLKQINIGTNLHLLEIDEEYSFSIFNVLTKDDDQLIIIDSNCGKLLDFFKVKKIEIDEIVDTETLELNSVMWDEPFYKKWELYTEYPIYIYNGDEIPYVRIFGDSIINKFTFDLKVENNGNFYVSKILKNDLLNNLPNSFSNSALNSLKNWHYKTLQNESLLDEDSFEYKENIDRLLQDRLGISEDDQKKESGNAKTHAVYFLDNEGFDVSQVKKAGASLIDIIDPDGNHIECIVRSAKGGLLYLDKEHWDMLGNSTTYLVVIYPGNTPRLFKNRLELLNEELAENVLFRIPNTKQIDEVNGVFDTLKSESHLILVTSEKMKESLFSKLKLDNQFNQEENSAVKGDDFKF